MNLTDKKKLSYSGSLSQMIHPRRGHMKNNKITSINSYFCLRIISLQMHSET